MEGAQHANGTEELGHQVLVAAAHTECVCAGMLVCVHTWVGGTTWHMYRFVDIYVSRVGN